MNKIILTFGVSILFLLINCSTKNYKDEEVTQNKKHTDYAENFLIQKETDFTLLQSQNSWINNSPQYQYLLYSTKQAPVSTNYPKANVIKTPISSAICLSTTHVAYLDLLGEAHKITGLSGTNFIYNENLTDNAAKGLLKEIGTSSDLNYELILSLQPDVIFLYSLGDQLVYNQLLELGLNPVMVNDFSESHPLGRAEWLKFFACFFQKEAEAEAAFLEMKSSYETLQQLAENEEQPSVFTGMGFEGVWYVPGNGNYMAQFIKDAGGNYIWKNRKEQGSIALDFEAMYHRSLNADVWINVGIANNKKDILNADTRYADFKAFKNNQVFNSNKRVSPNGGFDFYESATVKPQLVLKDLIKIFHPELLPEHTFVYYQPIE